jgi:hypothetical protein
MEFVFKGMDCELILKTLRAYMQSVGKINDQLNYFTKEKGTE